MKRRFCGKKCSYVKATRITINGDKANLPTPKSMGSWWLEGDFYANTRLRFPVDAGDKNSQPVQTFGEYDRARGAQ